MAYVVIDIGDFETSDLLDSLRWRVDDDDLTMAERRTLAELAAASPAMLEASLSSYGVPDALIQQIRPYLTAKVVTPADLDAWKALMEAS